MIKQLPDEVQLATEVSAYPQPRGPWSYAQHSAVEPRPAFITSISNPCWPSPVPPAHGTHWSLEPALADPGPGRPTTWPHKLHFCLLTDAMKVKGKMANSGSCWKHHYFLLWPRVFWTLNIWILKQGLYWVRIIQLLLSSHLSVLCKWQSLLRWPLFAFPEMEIHMLAISTDISDGVQALLETQLPPLCHERH